jgi:spore coat-associated protein N
MYRRILISLVAIGVLTSFMGLGGLSLFTATTDNDGNAFTTGSVDISTSPASAFLTMSDMAPGDSVTAQLTVSNIGTLDLRYAMTTDAVDELTPGLAAALTLEIREEGTSCGDWDGDELYNNSLAAGFIGHPAPGAQAGDREITVAAGSEVLCFRVTLPLGATGPEGAKTTAKFTFDAEQTKNN